MMRNKPESVALSEVNTLTYLICVLVEVSYLSALDYALALSKMCLTLVYYRRL
jgi:hypothetical protein